MLAASHVHGMEWACPEHPDQRAVDPGLCRCGYAMIPVEDLVDRQD